MKGREGTRGRGIPARVAGVGSGGRWRRTGRTRAKRRTRGMPRTCGMLRTRRRARLADARDAPTRRGGVRADPAIARGRTARHRGGRRCHRGGRRCQRGARRCQRVDRSLERGPQRRVRARLAAASRIARLELAHQDRLLAVGSSATVSPPRGRWQGPAFRPGVRADRQSHKPVREARARRGPAARMSSTTPAAGIGTASPSIRYAKLTGRASRLPGTPNPPPGFAW